MQLKINKTEAKKQKHEIDNVDNINQIILLFVASISTTLRNRRWEEKNMIMPLHVLKLDELKGIDGKVFLPGDNNITVSPTK